MNEEIYSTAKRKKQKKTKNTQKIVEYLCEAKL